MLATLYHDLHVKVLDWARIRKFQINLKVELELTLNPNINRTPYNKLRYSLIYDLIHRLHSLHRLKVRSVSHMEDGFALLQKNP